MRVLLVILIGLVLLLDTAEVARASDAGAARERMTAQLFAEYNGEGQAGFEYGDYVAGTRQLLMKEGPDATGAVRWVPVQLTVACSGPRCTGRIVEEGATVITDRATFRGRKGTYHETGWR